MKEEPSRDSFAQFIKHKKAGALGNTLAYCGIVTWEDAPADYWDDIALRWWESPRPCAIDWDKIKTICQESSTFFRNLGRAKADLLREFTGIPEIKQQQFECPKCPHCGRKYRKPINN